MNRRNFLISSAAVVASGVLSYSGRAGSAKARRYKAVAFDAFPIFDPRPVFALTSELFPGAGEQLLSLWRSRQFEYTWLRTLSEHYEDFPTVTREALRFAAKTVGVPLSKQIEDRLIDSYFHLKAWPDVLPALKRLKQRGIRLGFLSNFSRKMLEANIESAELSGYFEQVLSTDLVRAFKPAPKAYQMGVEAFGLSSDEIVFAAFAGWDAAGAKAFGYPTYWVNRQGSVEEELDVHVDGVGGMEGLEKFALGSRTDA